MSNVNVPSGVIFGCASLSLTDEEKEFFARVNPVGFILFARNVDTPEQVAALVDSLRQTTGRADVPVLIDQEGGRIQRLKAPHWEALPAGRRFGELYEKDADKGREAAFLNARYIGMTLAGLGIDVDCLPLLDLPRKDADLVIGDRAFSSRVDETADLGVSVCEGLMESGVLPIVKHIPGHGRATADSHKELPVVTADLETLKKTDFAPFKMLAHAPWAMTAHVMYTAVDDENPASLSEKVVRGIIRDYIGFDGFLICDDLSMKALNGDFADLTRRALAAGCDAVLHCNGDMNEMKAVAQGVSPLSEKSLARLEKSYAAKKKAALHASAKDKDEIRARVLNLLNGDA